jgi:hypothetical protein
VGWVEVRRSNIWLESRRLPGSKGERIVGGPDGDRTIAKYNRFKKVLALVETPADTSSDRWAGVGGWFSG